LAVFQEVLESTEERKLRGGFYTPESIANLLVRWAITRKNQTVLEPSFGDGNFLLSCFDRLKEKGANVREALENIWGTEISSDAYDIAQIRLSHHALSNGQPLNLLHQDFFQWFLSNRLAQFDAIVGNPPFIRYQNFPEPSRSIAMTIMSSAGLKPNRLTNIWVPFIVSSSLLLKPSGRIAMVVPAELLQVTYASQLRTFLVAAFKKIMILACNNLLFPGTEQEVVLLLAEKRSNLDSAASTVIDLLESHSEMDLIEKLRDIDKVAATNKTINHVEEKWTTYFLDNSEIGLMRELRAMESVSELAVHASVDVGVVTGENGYFIINRSIEQDYLLSKFTMPIVCRSSHLSGARFTGPDLKALLREDKRMLLLDLERLQMADIPPGLLKYLDEGKAKGIQKGYKCSIRKNWFQVPSIWKPEAFMFRQIHDFPKVVLNDTKATSTDTIHRMRIKADKDAFLSSYYTHLTAASAEIQGRSYGGGVLELEPNEAERLLMPKTLRVGVSSAEIDQLLRKGQLESLLDENDRIILSEHLGLSRQDCQKLSRIWKKLRNRRIKRR
jgi:adenine-specific DNA methylase